MKINPKYKGILFILLSAFCFAWMNVCVRMSGDVPTLQKSFFRNLIAVGVAAVMLARQGGGFRPAARGNLPYLLGRAICGTVGILGNLAVHIKHRYARPRHRQHDQDGMEEILEAE